jgi:aryl-alcohol dehydrogenase-like predicted oxidoreductase
LLVNKPAKGYLNYTEEEVKHAATIIASLSGEQRSAAQTTLQFVLRNPAVTAAVVGIRTIAQLEDAVKALDAPQLTIHEIDILEQAVHINYYDQHR